MVEMRLFSFFVLSVVLAGLLATAAGSAASTARGAGSTAVALNDAIFVNSGQSLGGETGNGVALGDLNGNGYLDAFVANHYWSIGPEANQVWFNDGNGYFTAGPALGNFDGYAVALGDLDGDGDLDAVVAGSEGNLVWINQGGAQGGQPGTFASGALLGTAGYGVAIGDVDNDGDLDVLVVGNSNQVWLNNGNATFSAGPQLAFLFSRSAVLADLDGDGWLDAVIVDSGSGASSRVWWNDGNWTPGPGSFTAGDPLFMSNLANAVAVGHLDGDDNLDIFLAGSGPDQIFWNEGGRAFSTAGPLPVSDNSSAVALADVDGDGRLDAVVGNTSADPIRLWRNEGSRQFTVAQEFGSESGLYWSRGLGLADLNGDGSPDLFEATTAEDRVWFNQSAPGAASVAWQIQTVAQRGRTGLGSSLALDAAGRPHISFVEQIQRADSHDYRLYYAAWDGQQWTSSVVDTAYLMAPSTSLALDSQGRPHIVYESNEDNSLDENLRYATWNGSEWQRQTVYANAEPDGFYSLALDAQERPHISFFHGVVDNDLYYARWDGAQWQIETVDAAGFVGRHNSLALDAAGNPHIAYYDNSAHSLKYASRSGAGPWQIAVVDSTVASGQYASLSLDTGDRPHIAYVSDGDVRYARHDGSAWQFDTIPVAFSQAERTVLALDVNDDPHLIWNVFPTGNVWYGRRQGGGWQTGLAANTPVAGGQDLAVDADLRPHISYYHSDYGDLRYAVLDEPWRIQVLDTPGLVERPSLALPVGGYNRPPELSYYKPPAGLLRHAAWENGLWQLTGIDFISAAGADPSLAIGNDGRPRVSYYDADSQQLRYAAGTSSGWISEVADTVAGTGRFSNLLLQGARPDIVYWDDNVRRIRLARWNALSQSWSYTVNLAGPPAGPGSGYLAAARLSDGRITVSYFQATGGQLRLATWNGESWTDSLVATGLAAAAPYHALAVDAVENEPAVAYYQPATQQIVYAFRQGAAWQTETAAAGVNGLTGLALQLALDSHRQPRISYAAADSLWLASGQDGAWRRELVYKEANLTLNGVSLVLGQRQHIAAGSSSGLRYAATIAASAGPEPLLLPPYDPVSPWLACFEFLFGDGPTSLNLAAAADTAVTGDLGDLDIFLMLTPLFQATAGGQYYVDLYGEHVQEMTGIVLSDTALLWDSFGTLQNFMPGLEALVSGRGDEVVVTQAMVDDALDIWQRLAAAGSPQLSATIHGELARYHNLQDFVGITFAEWVLAIGVNPSPQRLYLPLVAR
jgi:hypothetical protein